MLKPHCSLWAVNENLIWYPNNDTNAINLSVQWTALQSLKIINIEPLRPKGLLQSNFLVLFVLESHAAPTGPKFVM